MKIKDRIVEPVEKTGKKRESNKEEEGFFEVFKRILLNEAAAKKRRVTN